MGPWGLNKVCPSIPTDQWSVWGLFNAAATDFLQGCWQQRPGRS